MNESSKAFDWASFLIRVTVIALSATWLLIERLRIHDPVGAVLVIGIGYVVMPILAYLHTRYFNLTLMRGIVGTVKRMVTRRGS